MDLSWFVRSKESKDNSDVISKILYQNKFDLMNAYFVCNNNSRKRFKKNDEKK